MSVTQPPPGFDFAVGRSNELLSIIADLNVYVLFYDVEFLFCYVANWGWSVILNLCIRGKRYKAQAVQKWHWYIHIHLVCFSSPSLNKGPDKVPPQCRWQWKPPCPGCRFLCRPTSPMLSGPSPSKSGVSLFPHPPRPTRPTLPLHGSHIICPRCHHPRDVLLWTCSPSISPPGHLCLVPSASLLLQVLYMIPANSRPISVSALQIWACWEEDLSERCTRWARQHFFIYVYIELCITYFPFLVFLL